MPLFRHLAEKGSGDAQANAEAVVGHMYYSGGRGVPQNYA
jgi:TPR repeat protein